MRLARYLAHSGVASRRAAEELIRAGRVTVAGERVTDPARDVDESSGVEVDGEAVSPEPREVWMLNKPAGVVSTAREPGSRPAVVELVRSTRRLYPVGRLDVDSTGLILLTNDGELANRLTHPRYGVRRTYRVRVRRSLDDTQLRRLRHGVELDDGPTAPARARRVSPRVVELEIGEGRNRQVRRMIEAVGNEVLELQRIRFASLELGDLAEGRSRRLTPAEVDRLWKDGGRER
ncbi:MAG: rRNA synthase [Solirubrobacterales bacterium]|jgi:23S rRNA pseudouridine2605 synthase|nr:rRNA synthase [Solirubrobacterales bacterium]